MSTTRSPKSAAGWRCTARGADELDAAVLLAARTGFLPGEDTINAIRAELGAEGPLLYRYSGMAQQEGAFLNCTFWPIEALTQTGRLDEAAAHLLLDEVITYAGDTGLYYEEVDPDTASCAAASRKRSHLALSARQPRWPGLATVPESFKQPSR